MLVSEYSGSMRRIQTFQFAKTKSYSFDRPQFVCLCVCFFSGSVTFYSTANVSVYFGTELLRLVATIDLVLLIFVCLLAFHG